MEAQKTKELLLKKRSSLLKKIANYSMIVEENRFYSISALKQEIKILEYVLKSLQEQSLKTSKKVDM